MRSEESALRKANALLKQAERKNNPKGPKDSFGPTGFSKKKIISGVKNFFPTRKVTNVWKKFLTSQKNVLT